MDQEHWMISPFEECGYYGDFPSKDAAIAGGIAEGLGTFFVGKARPPRPLSDGIYADSIVENAIENLEEDWCLEFATFEPTADHYAILQAELRAVIGRWVEAQGLTPRWQLVDGIEKIPPS
jgi:hypothetical protein